MVLSSVMTAKTRVDSHAERNFTVEERNSIMNTKRLIVGMLTMCGALLAITPATAEEVRISSIEELAEYAGKSGNHVRMEPGLYRMTEHFTPEKISEMNQRINKAEEHTDKREAAEFISFNGDDNVFDLRGVTIEFETEKLREPLEQIIHTPEFVLRGDNNVLKGLKIINTGNGSSSGGCVFEVTGDGNAMRDCTLVVRGSYPYGYGDLFGFGGKDSQKLLDDDGKLLTGFDKHSGLRINGDNNRFIGVSIYMRSLGHAFYLQGGPENTYFEDCHVEGKMRPTDEMRVDPSGADDEYDFPDFFEDYYSPDSEEYDLPAIEARGGRIKPGHVKSLSEDAFRFYSAGKTTFVDCTAKNMRKGFAVSRGGPADLENCASIGNGDGFRVSAADDVIKNSRGDARYGPLLLVLGGGYANVDLELMPTESERRGWKHGQGAALIKGEAGSIVSISPWQGKKRDSTKPITIRGSNHTLTNRTSMPVRITEKARDCKVYSEGEIIQNDGENIKILEKGEINK